MISLLEQVTAPDGNEDADEESVRLEVEDGDEVVHLVDKVDADAVLHSVYKEDELE